MYVEEKIRHDIPAQEDGDNNRVTEIGRLLHKEQKNLMSKILNFILYLIWVKYLSDFVIK